MERSLSYEIAKFLFEYSRNLISLNEIKEFDKINNYNTSYVYNILSRFDEKEYIIKKKVNKKVIIKINKDNLYTYLQEKNLISNKKTENFLTKITDSIVNQELNIFSFKRHIWNNINYDYSKKDYDYKIFKNEITNILDNKPWVEISDQMFLTYKNNFDYFLQYNEFYFEQFNNIIYLVNLSFKDKFEYFKTIGKVNLFEEKEIIIKNKKIILNKNTFTINGKIYNYNNYDEYLNKIIEVLENENK